MNHQNICHEFFNQIEGRTERTGCNVFYNHDTLYSYGYHFPLYHKVRDKKGNLIAYFRNNDSYSVSTSKHVSFAYRACPGDVPTFDMSTNQIKSCTGFTGLASKLDKGFFKSVMQSYLKSAHLNMESSTKRRQLNTFNADIRGAKANIQQITDFEAMFKVKLRLKNIDKELIEALSNDALLETLSAKLKEKSIEAIAKAKRKAVIQLKKWKDGENVRPIRNGFDHLRIIDNHVETTQGLKFTCQESMSFYRLIRAKRINVGYQFKNYYVNHIDDKTIRLGCHTLTIKECLETGKLLRS